jgi:hypothetical protein
MNKDEARETLLHLCPPGTTVFNVLEHRAPSGASRVIKSYVFDRALPGETISERFISGYISILLDWKRPDNRDGIKVNGGGMDMGFHLVYTLASVLHGDGYALNSRWL